MCLSIHKNLHACMLSTLQTFGCVDDTVQKLQASPPSKGLRINDRKKRLWSVAKNEINRLVFDEVYKKRSKQG